MKNKVVKKFQTTPKIEKKRFKIIYKWAHKLNEKIQQTPITSMGSVSTFGFSKVEAETILYHMSSKSPNNGV